MMTRREVEVVKEKAYAKCDAISHGPDKQFWQTVAETLELVLGTAVDWHEELMK